MGAVFSIPETSSGTEYSMNQARQRYLLSAAQFNTTHTRTSYVIGKRLMDIILSATLLILLSPLLLLIALAIRMTSDGPAILVQERIGKGGRIFPFFKFRSMYNNIDRSVDQRFAQAYVNGGSPLPVPHDGVFKPATDLRVTRIGRLLRKASLDELPQLLNVLRGDMSLVGPRPSMPYEVEVYTAWHFQRLEALPGITGLAQISGRSSLPFREIVKFDLDYIERRSLLLDFAILLRTIPVVLSGHGAR